MTSTISKTCACGDTMLEVANSRVLICLHCDDRCSTNKCAKCARIAHKPR